MDKELIKQALKKYNFELNDKGLMAIAFQIELLYGKNPSVDEINEVVKNNSISFYNELETEEMG